VVAGTGCGSFADLLRPFCLADWSDEFSTNDRNGVSLVSGQQSTSRIFAIALASLAKMSISGMPISGIYAIASVSISMALVSAQCAGVSFPDCATD